MRHQPWRVGWLATQLCAAASGGEALVCDRPVVRRVRQRARAIGSAGERLVHTEEVTGSIPVSPTEYGRSPADQRPT